MRRAVAAIISVLAFFNCAGTAAAYDVSYSYDNTGPLICPDHSTLAGTTCYCNSGYAVSGKECVKIVETPPAENQIYEDIRFAVDLNDDMSCAQLGVIGQPDTDMCSKYKAASHDARLTWKSIQRPTASLLNHIDTPWAPSGGPQWSYGSNAQTVAPLTPTTTATSSATRASHSSETDASAGQVATTTAKADAYKQQDNLAQVPQNSGTSANAPPPTSAEKSDVSPSEATPVNNDGPSAALVELSKKLVAEGAANPAAISSDASSTPDPMPPPSAATPEPTPAQTAQAAQAVQDDNSDDPGGIIDRIIAFFRWLF